MLRGTTAFAGPATTPVQFAGFAYLGEAQDIEQSYPYTYAINRTAKSGQAFLDRELQKQFDAVELRHIVLNSDLVRLADGEGIALAISLDHEMVSVSKIGEGYRIVAELELQALFFDFVEKRIIGSYPVILEYIDYSPTMPNRAQKQAIIKGMYTGALPHVGERAPNILAEAANMLVDLRIKPKFNNHLKVTRVSVDEAPRSQLPPHLLAGNTAQIYLAQLFSSYLSRNQQVSVLPYTRGHAIGNRMSARFANGDIFNLSLPEADYAIELSLAALKLKNYDQNSVARSVLYGAAVRIRALEPLSEKVYLETRIKNAIPRVVALSQAEIEKWPGFNDSLRVLFDDFTRQLSQPSRKWVKKHTDSKSAYKQLIAFQDIVERCK